MNNRIESVLQLSARLPELLWKLENLEPLSWKTIPQGVFYSFPDITSKSCVEEIKSDLERLKIQNSERSARYLAEKVARKIHILVALCSRHEHMQSIKSSNHVGIKAMSTHHQWLASLQDEIVTLNEQQQALATRLLQCEELPDLQTTLAIQAALGEVERRLTLARETLARA
ncbi:hypothetical protein [Legionella nagasakiensis]|uniref:hypothetical protein n=1 Tax=Legionella nagasakiensis TaxID=535290 RepID=UPI0010545DCA|nr:hypothetical protein [Legionella nagasakiensis]